MRRPFKWMRDWAQSNWSFELSIPRQGRMYDEDLRSAIVSDKRMAQHSPILVLVYVSLVWI